MATDISTRFKYSILDADKAEAVKELLQSNLFTSIDLALKLKQAHWNVIGRNFRSVHLQLDEIIADVRASTDEIAERISALGLPADGRAGSVAQHSELQDYPLDFLQTINTVAIVAEMLNTTIEGLRTSIEQLGELDPISEDMCIAISGTLEKHLWMVQTQLAE